MESLADEDGTLKISGTPIENYCTPEIIIYPLHLVVTCVLFLYVLGLYIIGNFCRRRSHKNALLYCICIECFCCGMTGMHIALL